MSSIRAPWMIALVGMGLLIPPVPVVAQQETCGGQPMSVITRGVKPWRELRFAWEPGAVEASTIDVGMAFEVAMDDVPTMALDIRMGMDMEETVGAVSADGLTRLDLLLRDVRVEVGPAMIDGTPISEAQHAELVRAMEEGAQAMVGMTGWEVRDARGDVQDLDFDLPPGAPDTLREQFELDGALTGSACLPVQPVGIGAVWTIDTPAELSGAITAGLTVVNTIEAMDEGTVTMTRVMALDLGEAMRAQLSAVEGVEIVGVESTGGGRGRMVVDLARLEPVAEVTLDAGFNVTYDEEGTRRTMGMEIRADARVGPPE